MIVSDLPYYQYSPEGIAKYLSEQLGVNSPVVPESFEKIASERTLGEYIQVDAHFSTEDGTKYHITAKGKDGLPNGLLGGIMMFSEIVSIKEIK